MTKGQPIIGPWLREEMVVTVLENSDSTPTQTPSSFGLDFVILRGYVEVPAFTHQETHVLIEKQTYWVAKPINPITAEEWKTGLRDWFVNWAKDYVVACLEGKAKPFNTPPDWLVAHNND